MTYVLSYLTALAVFVFPSVALASDGGESKPWYTGGVPILLLLLAVAVVIWRLPRVKGEHLAHLDDPSFRTRRAVNWFVLGVKAKLKCHTCWQS
ncbi:MAG: hypothetical protein UX10_C0004G0045 [Candidatus Magasanikbacteria bacterium GW2011_GWA2_45_39]|uniref:Uncharacterized protein n=1 Tax=Candidatus Magasanikbacteria bacterium GW2011_GWA2_45_39 TaxID=1619041 RepID=A0A0G1MIJ9_9BACT|nr:MAG: hypothetical protein UX10_C0004G0045 [Candidatus Magasanikbacteria bacterium GW2011_GWA2_45_39]